MIDHVETRPRGICTGKELKTNRCWLLIAAAVVVVTLTAATSQARVNLTQASDANLSGERGTAFYVSTSQYIHHALIVGSDGMRADILEDLNHPIIQHLTNVGFYTRGHTQVDSNGVNIEQGTNENVPTILSGKPLHDIYGTGSGLLAEGYSGPGQPIPSTIETLFEVADRHGFYTGLIYSKSKAASMANPDGHPISYVMGNNDRDDSQVRDWAVNFVNANVNRTWYLLIWFSEPDYVQVGASGAYQDAVARDLDYLADIIQAMQATGTYTDSIIALTADHGMSDDNGHHGEQYWNDPHVYEVPWLVAAPGLELVHQGEGRHYNHELSATVSQLAWEELPTNSDSTVWLEGFLLVMQYHLPLILKSG